MLVTAFLIVALICFILAAIPQVTHGALIPVGLAFFAASFLVAVIR